MTGHEKETIILFNESDKEATVYTYNRAIQKKLRGLLAERPGEVHLVRETELMMECTIPKKWVKLRANRILSDAELEMRREIASTRFAGGEKCRDNLMGGKDETKND